MPKRWLQEVCSVTSSEWPLYDINCMLHNNIVKCVYTLLHLFNRKMASSADVTNGHNLTLAAEYAYLAYKYITMEMSIKWSLKRAKRNVTTQMLTILVTQTSNTLKFFKTSG